MHGKTPSLRMVEQLCFRLLPIQILLSAVIAVNSTASSLFASNGIGAAAMNAVGLFNPIRLFITGFGIMLLCGSQILCGKSMGKNQLSEIQRIFSLNLVLASLFALLMILLTLAAAFFDVARLFINGAQACEDFNQYLLGTAIGLYPMLLGQQLSGFLSLENQLKRTAAASVACIASNLALTYVFVFRAHMGTFGLALATSLSHWIFFGIQLLYYLRKKSELRLRFREIRRDEILHIVRIGMPSAASNGYLTFRNTLVCTAIIILLDQGGTSAIAAVNGFLSFVWAVPLGMLAVSRMLISVYYGEEDRRSLQDVMRVVLRRFVPITAVLGLLLSAHAEPLTQLYYRNPADPVYGLTLWGFRLLPLCLPLSTLCMHFVCYAQASEKQRLIRLMSLLDGTVLVVLLCIPLVPRFGVCGIYAANVLNGVLTALIILICAWVDNKAFPRSMEALLALPAHFGVSPDSRMDIAVRSLEEVVTVSRRVHAFCLDKGIDARRAYLAALAIEEMAGNVVACGFGRDKRKHCVDLRISCKADCLILRIRDDCLPLDPAEQRALFDSEDITKNIGIRMVYSLARDVRYQNIFGLNVLTIRM